MDYAQLVNFSNDLEMYFILIPRNWDACKSMDFYLVTAVDARFISRDLGFIPDVWYDKRASLWCMDVVGREILFDVECFDRLRWLKVWTLVLFWIWAVVGRVLWIDTFANMFYWLKGY